MNAVEPLLAEADVLEVEAHQLLAARPRPRPADCNALATRLRAMARRLEAAADDAEDDGGAAAE